MDSFFYFDYTEAKLRFAETSENTTKSSSRVLIKSKNKPRISQKSATSRTRTYDIEIMSLSH